MNSTHTRRPAIGTRVRVTFAESTGYDTATLVGPVIEHDTDSILIGGPDIATVYDAQIADGSAVLEVL